jgi:hypothetical protein
MIKIGDLRQGDIVKVNDEGTEREGTVVQIDHEEHQVLVDNTVQEFWYGPEDLASIPLNEEQLLKLGFEKLPMDGEGVKYAKGAFRLVTPQQGDFGHIEMWYREDRRHFDFAIGVHTLQNLHLQMTKVPLEMPA